MRTSFFQRRIRIQPISARDLGQSDGLRMLSAGELSRIELWCESIESFWMYGFKLRGIDFPLIRGDL